MKKAKNNKINRNKIKIGFLVSLIALLLWFIGITFLSMPGADYESLTLYNEGIRGGFIEGYNCDASVEGGICYPELANLDDNPELSESEAMLNKALNLYNNRFSDLYLYANISFWTILILGVIVGLNLVLDLRAKK
ncbi:MAG: hypothetical protein KKA62_01785 [Nanoarchaeota archaeon]|nr:hypothetical protein [Nanoarchaeota archaeon]MBU1644146.1 hypothetical protein [Nanoarchaeota archaeon]MBU1976664.1 hypothetical protein [Nanoarchaeota archaeon]